MLRLTNSIEYCKMHCDFGKGGECFLEDETKCYERNIYDKLREYELMEEQGLLLRLPITEGTEVYEIIEVYPYEEIEPWYTVCCEKFDRNMIEDFGETVFLTREEAEAALAKLKGEEHE